MKFTYQPEGAEPREWSFKAEKMLNVEAEAIERVSGIRFPDWTNELMWGRISAVHALLWVLLKRETPTLTYDAVQFTAEEYELDFDDQEKVEILADIDADVAAGKVLTPTEEEARNDLVAAVGHLVAEAPPVAPEETPEPGMEDAIAEGEGPKGTAVSLVS